MLATREIRKLDEHCSSSFFFAPSAATLPAVPYPLLWQEVCPLIRKRIAAFVDAGRGVITLMKTQVHAWVHLVATVGDAQQYRKGRDMAAALGLTPRQHSSGGKDRLLGISKRGDAYLRCLLVHGARSAMRTVKGKEDRLSRWVVNLQTRRHANVVAVALANKMARMAWVILATGADYDPNFRSTSVSA